MMKQEKDRRVRDHTQGVFITCEPCGIIRDIAELYHSEAIEQVWSIIMEYLSDLPQDRRNKLKVWAYDDMCHLKVWNSSLNDIFEIIHFQPFSEAQSQASHNEVTTYFAEKIVKVVDKLHFRGHKGAYCKANCDPRKVPELQKVNTVICEQTFKWLNAYKSVKSMNEPHFFFFMMYMIDLHNLSIEKKLRQLANPKSAERYNFVNSLKVEVVSEDTPGYIMQAPFTAKDAKRAGAKPTLLAPVDKPVAKVPDMLYSESDDGFTCTICSVVYKQLGYLKNHLKKAHGQDLVLCCVKCGTTFTRA